MKKLTTVKHTKDLFCLSDEGNIFFFKLASVFQTISFKNLSGKNTLAYFTTVTKANIFLMGIGFSKNVESVLKTF